MQKALLGGIAVSISCALIGPFLVLRRMSMIGDGLGHVAFGGIATGLWMGIDPIWSALISAMLASLWIDKLMAKLRIYGDAAIALIMCLGMGSGLIILGHIQGFSSELFRYLFGSLLTLSRFDILILYVLLAAIAIFIATQYKHLLFISFHESLARTSGVPVTILNRLLALMAGLAVVVAMRAVGVLLVSALLVIPSVSALQMATSFKQTLLLAQVFALTSVLLGLCLSYYANLPPGASIVVSSAALFILSALFKSLIKHRFGH